MKILIYILPFLIFAQPQFLQPFNNGNVTTVRFNPERHNYATEQAWNSSGTIVNLDGELFFENGNKVFINNTGLHWSKLHDNIQYDVWQNKIVKYEHDFKNATTQESYPYHFTDYQDIKLEGAHNETSLNDVMVLHGRKFENDNVWIVHYNPETNTYKEHETTIQHSQDYDGVNGLRWAKLSRTGLYTLIGYTTNGTAIHQGVWCYDTDWNGYQVTPIRNHSDVAQLKNGKDVYISLENYNAVVYDLTNGNAITVIPNIGNYHVSAQNYKELGYAFLSDEDSIEKFDLETGAIEDFGNTFNEVIDYYSETQASPNPFGNKVVFASNWNNTIETNGFVSYTEPILNDTDFEFTDTPLEVKYFDLLGRELKNLDNVAKGIYIEIRIFTNRVEHKKHPK